MISNKNNHKLYYMSVILGILLTTLVFSYFYSNGMNSIKEQNVIYSEFPKSAFDFNLTGQTIYIDDTDPNYSWSKTAAENGWCYDYGSSYLIDSVLIEGSSTLVTIKNSNVSFTIQDSKFSTSGYYCMYLRNVTNGFIINNVNISGANTGIFLYESSDNFISGNLLQDNNYGIRVYDSSNYNLIKNNVFQDNFYYGTMIEEDCSNNTVEKNHIFSQPGTPIFEYGQYGISILGNENNVTQNTISNMEYQGIQITSDSNYIAHNQISNTMGGIYSINSYGNVIFNNTINDMYYSIYGYRYGIRINYGINHKVLNNTIENVNDDAILLESGDNNEIVGNHIDVTNSSGISLEDCQYFNVSMNQVNNAKYLGISLFNSEIGNVSHNFLYNCGYNVDGDPTEMSNLDMDDSNKVNDKSLYFYEGVNNLDNGNVQNAGQIILYSCLGAVFSHLVLQSCSIGAAFYHCSILDLSDFDCSLNNMYGIKLINTNHTSVVGSNLSNNAIGINYSRCKELTIEDCNINNNKENGVNGQGIQIEILGNTIKDNEETGISSQGDGLIKDNEVSKNKQDGILVTDSTGMNVSLNIVTYNWKSGIKISNSDHCMVSGNTASRNADYGISMFDSSFCTVVENICNMNINSSAQWEWISVGIYIEGDYYDYAHEYMYMTSYRNIIAGNTLTNNRDSLMVEYSFNDTIIENTMDSDVWFYRSALLNVSKNELTIDIFTLVLTSYLVLEECNNFTVNYNILKGTGVALEKANYSTFIGNQISDGDIGFDLQDSSYNKIINNTIMRVTQCFWEHGECIGNEFTNNVCQQGILLPLRELGALIGGVGVVVVVGIMFVKRRKYLR